MYLDPDWATSALLIIDVQNDFAIGPRAVEGTADRIPELARLATSFRAAGRPIVHIVRSYAAGESDVDLVRRAAIESGDAVVRPGTRGADIPAALLPHALTLDWNLLRSGETQQIGPDESVMYKPRWSAFHRTSLDRTLRDLGIDTVVVAGCNLPNCPRATLFDASERDYRTVLVVDATSQTTPERLADLELIGVRLRTVDDAVAELSVIPPAP